MDYALLHCFTCGVNWEDHSPECFNHRHRDHRMAAWAKVKRTLTARDLNVLRANGWRDETEEVVAHG